MRILRTIHEELNFRIGYTPEQGRTGRFFVDQVEVLRADGYQEINFDELPMDYQDKIYQQIVEDYYSSETDRAYEEFRDQEMEEK